MRIILVVHMARRFTNPNVLLVTGSKADAQIVDRLCPMFPNNSTNAYLSVRIYSHHFESFSTISEPATSESAFTHSTRTHTHNHCALCEQGCKGQIQSFVVSRQIVFIVVAFVAGGVLVCTRSISPSPPFPPSLPFNYVGQRFA